VVTIAGDADTSPTRSPLSNTTGGAGLLDCQRFDTCEEYFVVFNKNSVDVSSKSWL
jgi:hypothetical protein